MPESSGAREKHFNVRASAQEYQRIQQSAERHGLSGSEYLRVLGSSEQWLLDELETLRQWQGMFDSLSTVPTPSWTTRAEEARQRIDLIEAVLIVIRRVREIADGFEAMLLPTAQGMHALLEQLDRLAQAQQAGRDVSAERPNV
jgi:hypothetical protein